MLDTNVYLVYVHKPPPGPLQTTQWTGRATVVLNSSRDPMSAGAVSTCARFRCLYNGKKTTDEGEQASLCSSSML